MKKKQFLYWLIAFLITLSVAVFQRMTGPSHPLRGQENLGGSTISYSLPRSAETGKAMTVTITAPGVAGATLHYRKQNSLDDWSVLPMSKNEGLFQGAIPSQPPAGKVAYRIEILTDQTPAFINKGNPVVARFRGAVPPLLLILHILFMFSSLLFASRCIFSPWDRLEFTRILVWTTSALLFIGGLILGPLVQKYAFGHYWTGFPFGSDLTDNKTLFILLIWISTLFLYKSKKIMPGIAALLKLLIYLIPHSLLGSELDYRTGRHKNVYSRASIASPLYTDNHEPQNPA